MRDIKTVFNVDGEGFTVTGYGQQATNSIFQHFPKAKKIKLVGFLIDSETKITKPVYNHK